MLSGRIFVLFTLLAVSRAADFVSCLGEVGLAASDCELWDDITTCLENGGNHDEAEDVWKSHWSWLMENCVPDETKCEVYLNRLELYLKNNLEDNMDNRRMYVAVHSWLEDNCSRDGVVTESVLLELYNHMINIVSDSQ